MRKILKGRGKCGICRALAVGPVLKAAQVRWEAEVGIAWQISRGSLSFHRSVSEPRREDIVVAYSTRRKDSELLLAKLSTTTTSWPASSSSRQTWLPMYPAPPVTRMDMRVKAQSDATLL